MAFSQPLSESVRQKGQAALLCQLCENNPKLKWKCLDCELMMCERCADKVHSKFKSAEDHIIIDIKDISKHQTDSGPKLDFSKLKCEVHSGKICCMFCKTCQELVCQTCIAKTHNKHDFGEINDEYKTKVEKITKRLSEIEQGNDSLTTQGHKLKQIKSVEKSKYDKMKQEILEDEKALVNEIKTHTNKLLKDLDQKWKACSNRVEKEEQILREKQSQIQKQIQDVNNLLQPNNAKDVFSVSDSLFTQTKITPVNTSLSGVPKFTYGDRRNLSPILGKLEDVTIQYNTELKREKEFETDLKSIDKVLSCQDGSLWLSNSTLDTIQNVKPNGDKLGMMSNFELTVIDAALLPSGDLLLSVSGSSKLKLVPSGSTDITESVYTVSPLYPASVHVTCDNKVIVGAVDRFKIPATGPRQVIVMDQRGHKEEIFQYDKSNKPLLTYQHRITSNSQGNIAVVDLLSDDGKGRVVILDQEGEVRNIYTGHSDINNDNKPFKPKGITGTPSDNFVITHRDTHTLHILNSEGEIITFCNTEEMGILLPYSLSFSATGQLYIGNSSPREGGKAKLFKLDDFFF